MRAIRVTQPGGPEALTLVEEPSRAPESGQVRVRVEAAGVNYIDVYHRTGAYKQALPVLMGLEGAGVVEALGPGVEGLAAGDRVAWASVPGSYASEVNAPADKLVRVPSGVTAETAAAAMLQGMTAQYLVTSTYPLAANERCLVHAAAGGVGLILCQLARRRGARVYGTVSTEEKAARARRAGAEATILYTQVDFAEELARLTGGEKVSVVYDGVGRATFEKGFDCLRRRGMMVLFGQASGPVAPFDPQVLNQKGSLFLARPNLAHYTATREELTQRAGDVFAAILAGELELAIDSTFPLERAADAHRALESRKTSGKLLLVP